METIIILATGFVGVTIGTFIGHLKSSDCLDLAMWEIDKVKRQEAEFKNYQYENQLRNHGVCAPDFACTARHAIQLEEQYRKGYYYGRKEATEVKMRFKTLDETQLMFEKLSAAMAPLEKLRENLNNLLDLK